MDKDIRLYEYTDAILRKVHGKIKHNYKSVEECIHAIETFELKMFHPRVVTKQFVIVEYTDVYKSKIIKLYDKTYTNKLRNNDFNKLLTK